MSFEIKNPVFSDSDGQVNYNDFKERFPKIRNFFALIDQYNAADNLYVPTNRTEINLGIKYKQGDIVVDWSGSWHEITDAYNEVSNSIRELVSLYGQAVTQNQLTPSPDVFKPETRNHPYLDEYTYYYQTVFYRTFYKPLDKDFYTVLMNMRPWVETAMLYYESKNAIEITAITKQREQYTLMSKTIGALSGTEFFKLLDLYFQYNPSALSSKPSDEQPTTN